MLHNCLKHALKLTVKLENFDQNLAAKLTATKVVASF